MIYFLGGHVAYQAKALEKYNSETPILCPFDPELDRQQLKMTLKTFLFLSIILSRGARPNRFGWEAGFFRSTVLT